MEDKSTGNIPLPQELAEYFLIFQQPFKQQDVDNPMAAGQPLHDKAYKPIENMEAYLYQELARDPR
jgi:hypothetical protein